jgi:hypothetical protein
MEAATNTLKTGLSPTNYNKIALLIEEVLVLDRIALKTYSD